MGIYQDLKSLQPEKRHYILKWITGESAGTTELCDETSQIVKGLSGSGILERKEECIFCERLSVIPELVICGSGHVAAAVVRMAKMLGFHVTVVEDRPQFAAWAREAGADRVICDSFANALPTISGGADTYFLIMTRGHRYDMDCLEILLTKPFAYLGMMGSRRRTAIVRQAIQEKGFSDVLLDQIHMPVGLDIFAETPEEIALSVMSEIVLERNRAGIQSGYPKELLDALAKWEEESNEDAGRRAVLATIIRKRGSGPRSVGTKMLILPDGRCVGTIGGGCTEAEIVTKARQMHLHPEERIRVVQADMTAEDAGEEGMVCGGIFDVLLEQL